MVVGTLRVEFLLHDNRSLKGKRKIVRSMIDKVKHKFNAAVAEIGSNDKWQKIEIGISTVGNDRRHIDASLNTILVFLESLYLAEIVDTDLHGVTCRRFTPERGKVPSGKRFYAPGPRKARTDSCDSGASPRSIEAAVGLVARGPGA